MNTTKLIPGLVQKPVAIVFVGLIFFTYCIAIAVTVSFDVKRDISSNFSSIYALLLRCKEIG